MCEVTAWKGGGGTQHQCYSCCTAHLRVSSPCMWSCTLGKCRYISLLPVVLLDADGDALPKMIKSSSSSCERHLKYLHLSLTVPSDLFLSFTFCLQVWITIQCPPATITDGFSVLTNCFPAWLFFLLPGNSSQLDRSIHLLHSLDPSPERQQPSTLYIHPTQAIKKWLFCQSNICRSLFLQLCLHITGYTCSPLAGADHHIQHLHSLRRDDTLRLHNWSCARSPQCTYNEHAHQEADKPKTTRTACPSSGYSVCSILLMVIIL